MYEAFVHTAFVHRSTCSYCIILLLPESTMPLVVRPARPRTSSTAYVFNHTRAFSWPSHPRQRKWRLNNPLVRQLTILNLGFSVISRAGGMEFRAYILPHDIQVKEEWGRSMVFAFDNLRFLNIRLLQCYHIEPTNAEPLVPTECKSPPRRSEAFHYRRGPPCQDKNFVEPYHRFNRYSDNLLITIHNNSKIPKLSHMQITFFGREQASQ